MRVRTCVITCCALVLLGVLTAATAAAVPAQPQPESTEEKPADQATLTSEPKLEDAGEEQEGE